MKKRFLSIIAGTSLLISSSAMAGMYCGKSLVMEGDSTYKLLQRCGSPSRVVSVSAGIDGIGENVEKWYYDFGERRLLYILTIRGDSILKIKEFSH